MTQKRYAAAALHLALLSAVATAALLASLGTKVQVLTQKIYAVAALHLALLSAVVTAAGCSSCSGGAPPSNDAPASTSCPAPRPYCVQDLCVQLAEEAHKSVCLVYPLGTAGK